MALLARPLLDFDSRRTDLTSFCASSLNNNQESSSRLAALEAAVGTLLELRGTCGLRLRDSPFNNPAP